MNEEIADYELMYFHKRMLRSMPEGKKFVSQTYCHEAVLRIPLTKPGVFVIANDKTSKLFGVSHCDSTWSCPVCSAQRMSMFASKIASALDAIEHYYKKVGFMITFAIPHIAKFTCKQAYEILRQTWNLFYHHGNKVKSDHKNDPFANFNETLGCNYRIKVCEFTYGKNGWHPHYHAIFFVDKNKLQDVMKFQEILANRWHKCSKHAMKKILRQDEGFQNIEWNKITFETSDKWVDYFYEHLTESPEDGCFISRNRETGQIIKAQSSQYICGWGADKELTGNIRKEASHSGHYTPHQILKLAFEADKNNDLEECDKWYKLYLEYDEATLNTYRVKFSPGMRKIIDNWRLTNEYIEIYKKKVQETQKNQGHWKIVVWFTEKQWLQILALNDKTNKHLITNILKLAIKHDGKSLIEQLLMKYNLDISKNGTHPNQKFFEKFIAA